MSVENIAFDNNFANYEDYPEFSQHAKKPMREHLEQDQTLPIVYNGSRDKYIAYVENDDFEKIAVFAMIDGFYYFLFWDKWKKIETGDDIDLLDVFEIPFDESYISFIDSLLVWSDELEKTITA